MNRTFDNLTGWTVDQRRAVVAVILLVSTIAGLGYYDADLLPSFFAPETSVEPVTEQPEDDRSDVPDVSPLSLSDAGVVIVAQSDQFFSPDGARGMRQVVADLEALDQVSEILWMDRVPILNIFGLPEPLFPRSQASDRRFKAARKKALRHPLVVGQLLSEDGKTLLLMVTLNHFHVFSDADATTLLKQTAQSTAEQFPEFDVSFQVTGRVPTFIAAVTEHESNQLKYQLIGFGMIGLMTIILFRGVRAVIIVALAPALGVIWTIGMIQYIDYGHDNRLIDVILPILVALVGITDGVHLMVQIRKLRTAGLSERDAARAGIQQVGLACFLTSLTTAIGFGSLTLADSTFVQDFGVCSVIGVCLSFIAVVTTIPLACSTSFGRNIHLGHENSLVDRHLGRISGVVDVVVRNRNWVSVAGIAATAGLFAVSMTLEPDQRRSDNLPAGAEATQALNHLDEVLGGLEFGEIEIRWSQDVPSDSPEVLLAVTAVDDMLRSEELISHPLSIRSLIDAQPGSGPPAERMSMLELLPPPLKRAFYRPEERRAVVNFRVRDLGIARYGPVFERIEQSLSEIETGFPEFTLSLEGQAAWRWRNLYQIVVDLAASLGTASVIILIVLAIVFRSIRIGLISIIPNLFPLVFSGAYLALSGYNLEIVMVCCFTVCLGIAVDDTIHFLTRFQEEQKRTNDIDEAIRRAFTGVGSALIMTTTVLIAGFSTVMFSESRDHRIFATMGALTIAAALFGDMVFLPALLARFASRPSDTTDPSVQENRAAVEPRCATDRPVLR